MPQLSSPAPFWPLPRKAIVSVASSCLWPLICRTTERAARPPAEWQLRDVAGAAGELVGDDLEAFVV